jgi:GT2 family glycosyltransferase
MRRAVHAVVIVRRRGDRLIQTLEAIRGQSRRPDTITVVDLTGEASSEEVFREQLGRDSTVTIVAGRPSMGWSEALNLGRESLPEAGWAWVLRDDTTPEPEALKALTTTVDGPFGGHRRTQAAHGGPARTVAGVWRNHYPMGPAPSYR